LASALLTYLSVIDVWPRGLHTLGWLRVRNDVDCLEGRGVGVTFVVHHCVNSRALGHGDAQRRREY